jgi:UDP-N-acetylglucosamine 2-epimerase (non-hydrolysing)
MLGWSYFETRDLMRLRASKTLRPPLVASIIGTRPEAIKMAPVIRALAACSGMRQEIILTGQHVELLESFEIPPVPIRKLAIDLREQTAGEIRDSLRHALCLQLFSPRPNLVLVQGDTSSALAGALAACDCGIPIGHVEAGLRSGDLQQPWPEEGNRIMIDAISDLLFAPSDMAAKNLRAEPDVTGAVHVTGNSGIDALFQARSRYNGPADQSHRKLLLVTCHRRENRGEELCRIAGALKRLVSELPVRIVFLLHPNRHVRSAAEGLLAGVPHICLLDPVDHQEMVRLMDCSWLILTDSGGLQEEGPALGRPVLVLRNRTERAEAVECENVQLVGTDPEGIFGAVARLLHDPEAYTHMARPRFPFGDGNAAPRIAALICDFLLKRQEAPLMLVEN